MALIVETGAGLSNANSYLSLAEANTYHVDRGSTVWTNSVPADAAKEIALIKATDYLDAWYRERWKGRKNTSEQALTWPRSGVVIDGDGSDGFIPGVGPIVNGFTLPSNEIPTLLKRAVAELALRALSNELAPDIDSGEGSIVKKKVGPLEVEYAKGGYIPYKIWRWVDTLVAPLVEAGDLSIKMERSF